MGTTNEQPFAQYQSLFEASKPRSVRIGTFDRIILITLPVVGVILFYFNATEILGLPQPRISSSQIVGAVPGLVFAAILLVVGCVTAWKVRRDKKLMRNGELVVAVVTHQRLVEVRSGRGGKKKRSRVRYRFKDPSGQLYQGTGTDHSRRLRVDMTVPVFYDPANPERNVGICTASCELEES
jgi:uncharacterized protein DUF3592